MVVKFSDKEKYTSLNPPSAANEVPRVGINDTFRNMRVFNEGI